MDVRVAVGDIAQWKDEAIVVNLFDGVSKPGGATGAVDKALGGALSQLIAAGDIKAKFKECYVLPTLGKISAVRVFVVGLGERGKFTLDRVREASAKACLQARALRLDSISTIVHGAGIGGMDLADATEAVAEGAVLGTYRFARYKTKEEDGESGPDALTLVTTEKRDVRTIEKAIGVAQATAKAVGMARDMVNAPSNDKTPRHLADTCMTMARDVGLKCVVYDEKDIQKLGMGALWGVARGSEQPPRFVVLE